MAKTKKAMIITDRHRKRTAAKAKKQPSPPRRSKYVGVTYDRIKARWQAQIRINDGNKFLGRCKDEKEAARMYDEQAILMGRPVNFPLHEGQIQAVKAAPRREGVSKLPNVNRPSKYVGVSWVKKMKKWEATIKIKGKSKCLGYSLDEKEAARVYDEQAILLGKPVNFPLHEGMEQAVKKAPKGTGTRRNNRASRSQSPTERVNILFEGGAVLHRCSIVAL